MQCLHQIALKVIEVREGLKRELYDVSERVHKGNINLAQFEVTTGSSVMQSRGQPADSEPHAGILTLACKLRITTISVIECVYAWRAALRRRAQKETKGDHSSLMLAEHDYTHQLTEVSRLRAHNTYQAINHARSTADGLLRHRFDVLQRQIKAANRLEEAIVAEYEPFLFAGRNYMETMLHDTDFLAGCLPLARLLGIRTDFLLFNPLFLQQNLLSEQKQPDLSAEQTQLAAMARVMELAQFLPVSSGNGTEREECVKREVALLLQHCFKVHKQPHVWPPTKPLAEAKRASASKGNADGPHHTADVSCFLPRGPLDLQVVASVCLHRTSLSAVDSIRLQSAAHEYAAECNDLRRYMRLQGELAWTPRLQSDSASIHCGGLIAEAKSSAAGRMPRTALARQFWARRVKHQTLQEDNMLRGFIDLNSIGVPQRVLLPKRLTKLLKSFSSGPPDRIGEARFAAAESAAAVAAFSNTKGKAFSVRLQNFQSTIEIASSIVSEVASFERSSADKNTGSQRLVDETTAPAASRKRQLRLHMSVDEVDLQDGYSSAVSSTSLSSGDEFPGEVADASAVELASQFNARRPTPQATESGEIKDLASWFPSSPTQHNRMQSASFSSWQEAGAMMESTRPGELDGRAKTAPVFGGFPSPDTISSATRGSGGMSYSTGSAFDDSSSPPGTSSGKSDDEHSELNSGQVIFHSSSAAQTAGARHKSAEPAEDQEAILWTTASRAKLNKMLPEQAHSVQHHQSLDGDDFLLSNSQGTQHHIPEHMTKFFSASDAGIGSLTLGQLEAMVGKSSLEELQNISFIPGYDYHALGPDSVEEFMNADAPRSRSARETRKAHERLRLTRPWHQKHFQHRKQQNKDTKHDLNQKTESAIFDSEASLMTESMLALKKATESTQSAAALKAWLTQEEAKRKREEASCKDDAGEDITSFKLRMDTKLLRTAIKSSMGRLAKEIEQPRTSSRDGEKAPELKLDPQIEAVMMKLLGPEALRDELAEAEAQLAFEQADAAAAHKFNGQRASDTRTSVESLNSFFASATARLAALRGTFKQQEASGLSASIVVTPPPDGSNQHPTGPSTQLNESIVIPGGKQPLEISADFLAAIESGTQSGSDRPRLPPIAKDIQRRVFGEPMRVAQSTRNKQQLQEAIQRCTPRTKSTLQQSTLKFTSRSSQASRPTASPIPANEIVLDTQSFQLSAIGKPSTQPRNAEEYTPQQSKDFDGSTVRTKANLAQSWNTSLQTAHLGKNFGTGMSSSQVAQKAKLINFSSMKDEFAKVWSAKLQARGMDTAAATAGRKLALDAEALILPKV